MAIHVLCWLVFFGGSVLASAPTLHQCMQHICQNRETKALACLQTWPTIPASFPFGTDLSCFGQPTACAIKCEKWKKIKKNMNLMAMVGYCFATCAARLPPFSQLLKNHFARAYKNSAIRNAIPFFQKAASEHRPEQEKLFLRHQIVQLVQQSSVLASVDGSSWNILYQIAHEEKLRIGYAKLTVILTTIQTPILLEIQGYRFHKRHHSRLAWTLQELLPGTYTILAHYPNGLVKQQIVLSKQAEEQMLVASPPSQPVAPWGIGIAGVAVLLSGGIILGLGYHSLLQRDQKNSYLRGLADGKDPVELQKIATQISVPKELAEMRSSHDTATWAVPVGWSLAATGTAAVLGASLWLLLSRKTRSAHTTPIPPPPSAFSTLFWEK